MMTPEELAVLMKAQDDLAVAQDALAAERTAHATTQATLTQRTQQLATRTAQRDAAIAQRDALAQDKADLQADKANLQADKAALQDKVAEWKLLAGAPENPSLTDLMQRCGNLRVRIERLTDERDDFRSRFDAYRTDAERQIAALEKEIANTRGPAPHLWDRMQHLAALLDARCELPRGHA